MSWQIYVYTGVWVGVWREEIYVSVLEQMLWSWCSWGIVLIVIYVYPDTVYIIGVSPHIYLLLVSQNHIPSLGILYHISGIGRNSRSTYIGKWDKLDELNRDNKFVDMDIYNKTYSYIRVYIYEKLSKFINA